MSNIFNGTGVYYFQVPQEIMTTVWPVLLPCSQSLYIHLLFIAQMRSKLILTQSAIQIEKGTGLSPKSVKTAREDLETNKLVRATRTKGSHVYEILDPFTGQSIQKVKDLNLCAPELLEDFYMHHLRAYNPFQDGNGLRARCPFHFSIKSKAKDLSVKLTEGGPFRCFDKGCGKSGKLVEFERSMAGLSGPAISISEAHHRVQTFMETATRNRAKIEADELAERRSQI